jgi:hypothetical protein
MIDTLAPLCEADLESDAKPPLVYTLENGITNLHINLKSLEGKYIDLANFYKQELLSKDRLKVGQSIKQQI